jgi:nucleoside-diphosphate-sugar epimerase
LRYVIFGGTGFIGTHLSQFLLEADASCELVLADLNPPRHADYAGRLSCALSDGRARFVTCDVRSPIDDSDIGPANIVFNLAAVHREPGHQPHEYFHTNIRGAENVCAYVSGVGAAHLVFTSTIAAYGRTDRLTTEESLPQPETPYGCSKLIAEDIHRAWQNGASDRRLLILRPGVVFGPGEAGNVTRLIRSLIKGYFVYMGNRTTRKAGGYVKELCEVIWFAINYQMDSGEALTLMNFTATPPAPLEDFVNAIQLAAGLDRMPLTVPRSLVMASSYLIDSVARTVGIKQPISPTRVRKLFRATNVEATRLSALGYEYRYSLRGAFEDWKQHAPSDFELTPLKNRREERPTALKSSSVKPASETIAE